MEILTNLGSATTDVIFNDYHSSYRNIHRRLSHNATWKSSEEINNFKRKKQYEYEKEEIREKQRFSNLISYLKRQGLVERSIKENNKFWALTSLGLAKFKKIKAKNKNNKRPLKCPGAIEKDDLKVVVFDIPEDEKYKRKWLRESLKNLNFTMLQKSVWIGKSKLPEEFILGLREFKLTPYVHIFLVKDKGTMGFM